jgi:hypothetical protein
MADGEWLMAKPINHCHQPATQPVYQLPDTKSNAAVLVAMTLWLTAPTPM